MKKENDDERLKRRISFVLTHAREAWERKEQYKRKFDTLPKGAEIHIQFIKSNVLRVAVVRIGKTPSGKALRMLHTELDTVIKHWPEPHTRETADRKLIPSEEDDTGRYWLVATMTIATQLGMFGSPGSPRGAEE